MDKPSNLDPQEMLESVFKTMYDNDASEEASRIQEENELHSYLCIAL